MNWQDLRYALAVGQHGSLKRAAEALHINPTTVSRRVSALEAELGITMFVRTRKQWRPTREGMVILARCEKMAEEVRSLRHDTERASGKIYGKVRITSVDMVITTWLVPKLPQLRALHPGLGLEFFTTYELVNLFKGRADIALRLKRPTQAGLIVKRLTTIPLVVAGTDALAALPPAERPVILIGFFDSDTAENRAVRAHGGPIISAATGLSVAISLVLSGMGIGLLPRDLAQTQGFTQFDAKIAPRHLWRAVPEELAHAPRIRAVTNWLDSIFSSP